MKISWIGSADRIKHELKQCGEEGHDISLLNDEWDQILIHIKDKDELNRRADEFYLKIEKAFLIDGKNKNEPSGWEEIKSQANFTDDKIPAFSSEFVADRILGGWLGRSAGCLLGKPVEKTQRAGIKELLQSNNTWPLSDYVTGIGIPEDLLQKYPWNRHSGKESLKENIDCMTEDDDMNYPMVNLYAAELYGEAITTENIIQSWLEMMPVLSTFTAERVAYLNVLNGIPVDETARYRNPYREWIGAQIRADLWGWISPAQPNRAADFAWRDASLSHTGNGIYGEIFIACAIAASFKYTDMRDIINEALKFIPQASRLYKAITYVLSLPVEETPWEDVLDLLYEKFGQYHWVHTINNAALVTAALISSKGDFERAVCNVVMGGWDTDSNGATAGSIMGTMLGASQLPEKWISPLKNKIRSSIKGFDNITFTELAERTVNKSFYLQKKGAQ